MQAAASKWQPGAAPLHSVRMHAVTLQALEVGRQESATAYEPELVRREWSIQLHILWPPQQAGRQPIMT